MSAMTPYSKTINGLFTRTTVNQSLYVPPNPAYPPVYSENSAVLTDMYQASHQSLANILSSHGDFSMATPHAYRKIVLEFYSGSTVRTETSRSSGGGFTRSIVTSTGPTGEQSAGSSIDLAAVRDIAHNACVSRLYDEMRGKMDLSVSVAEGNQVRRMLNSAAKLNRYVRKWNWKEVSNTWLEFCYGWRPLANDLYRVVNEVTRLVAASQKVDIRGTHTEKRSVVTNTWPMAVKIEMTCSARSRICFVWTPTPSSVNQAARLTSLNPLNIAWELMPYSFVVDWFVDVGGYLRNLESSLVMSGTLGNGYTTRTHNVVTTAVKSGMGVNPNDRRVEVAGMVKSLNIDRGLIRSVLKSLPIPARPRFNPNLGATRLISAAALLSQFVKQEYVAKRRAPRVTNARFNRARIALKRSNGPV